MGVPEQIEDEEYEQRCGRSASPARPSSAYRPRQRRTVSTVTRCRQAIFALE
jgi:hypothetical protein